MVEAFKGANIAVFDFPEFETYPGCARWDETLEQLLALPQVAEQNNVPDAKGGRALSTVHLSDKLNIPKILNFTQDPLGRWLLTNVLYAAADFGLDKTRDIKKMKFHRTWVNRMTKGCDAVAHRHAAPGWNIPHMVAIFYTQVPESGADLVFIDDNSEVMRAGSICEYPVDKTHLIQAKAGRLVCHDACILHGTTPHLNDLPRTCIILEIGFAPK